MVLGDSVLRFGPPPGAAGVDVYEESGGNVLSDPSIGSIFLLGVAKRGPMGQPVQITNKRQYLEIYGDPGDATWHLFDGGQHLMPDAIDGFFSVGGGAGQIFVTRLELDGKARCAEITLKNRIGADALKIKAANEGRWGGATNSLSLRPIITATSRTFTLIAPGVEANEFMDAIVSFTGGTGRAYSIVANTAADETSGEVIFTIGSQYSLSADGVVGPVALSGTASYTRNPTLSGAAAFPLYTNLTGTVQINGRVITGVGTAFTDELAEGRNVYYNGEARSVTSITSDTTLTIEADFSTEGTGLTIQKDNLVVTGTNTVFLTELAVGQMLYGEINNALQGRTIAAITSNTSLTLTSGFTAPLTPGSLLQKDGLTITGTNTLFSSELTVGQYIVDPNREGNAVKVKAIASATSLTIEKVFSRDFAGAQLTKQSQLASIALNASRSIGLSIQIGQGVRYPDTHFSLSVFFNGSQVVNIQDASLDPSDPAGLFVEPLVNDSNVAYRTGERNYQKWVTAESLWSSAYTTAPGADVRPCNASGRILAMTKNRVYTVADAEYDYIVGSLLYPNPYRFARGYYRIKRAAAPVILSGTVSSNGVNVTGTSTIFTTEVKAGDYLYDPNTDSVQMVQSVQDDTHLTLKTVFSQNLPPLTKAKLAGYMDVDQGYDLTQTASVGNYFLMVYPQILSRGYDGDTANILPYYLSKYADPDFNVIETAVYGKNVGLLRIATPGYNGVEVQKEFANYASLRAFEYRGEIPSQYNSAVAAEAFINQDLGRNNFISLAFPSYGYMADPLRQAGDRMISLSGDIMGGESLRAVSNGGYHYVFAGITAILSRIIKVPFSVSPQDEGILNVAGVQPIKKASGNTVVFGSRGPALSPTYDFLHIRRIQSNYVRIFLEARTLMELLFLPNQPELVEQIILILNNFARREYKKGVITNYLSFNQSVQIQGSVPSDQASSDNSSEDAIVSVINGRLSIYFRYVPTGILERLSIHAGPDILVARYGTVLNSTSTF